MSIDYKHDAHIVTITSRPAWTRNSLDMEHFRDLAHAWAAFATMRGVGRRRNRCRSDFCTGADLKQFIQN